MEKQNYQGKGNHQASYREKLAGDTVRCILCPHCCILQDGKTGICRARENFGGELYSMSYGNPCSISVDPIEKETPVPLFPRIRNLFYCHCRMQFSLPQLSELVHISGIIIRTKEIQSVTGWSRERGFTPQYRKHRFHLYRTDCVLWIHFRYR